MKRSDRPTDKNGALAAQADKMVRLKILFRGARIVYAECRNCKNIFQFDPDKPYVFCPYCADRLIMPDEPC